MCPNLDCVNNLGQSSSLEARAGDDRQGLAEALVKRGYILNDQGRYSEAIPHHGGALQLVDPKSSAAAARLHQSALINLAYAVSQSLHPKTASTALRYIREAQRTIRGQRRSLPRHRLQWIEGKMWLKLCAHRLAEQAFKVGDYEAISALSLWVDAVRARKERRPQSRLRGRRSRIG